MYRAKNGLTLKDDMTPQGWKIRTAADIVTALMAYPNFATVSAGMIYEVIYQATEERKEYENITDLAEYLAEYYI